MNNEEALKLVADTNQRIQNALETCVKLSAQLTEERNKSNQQAEQLDMLCAALMFMMIRHRFEFINIERTDLSNIAKSHFIYFEVDPASSVVYIEKRLREIPYAEAVKECSTLGNTGTEPKTSEDPATNTTSHYEHNPNNEATALPS